jgi:pyruvate,water dikinase
VHYRAVKGIDHAGKAMGVVVMEMVPSRVSGITFTVNPVTGSAEEPRS